MIFYYATFSDLIKYLHSDRLDYSQIARLYNITHSIYLLLFVHIIINIFVTSGNNYLNQSIAKLDTSVKLLALHIYTTIITLTMANNSSMLQNDNNYSATP